MKDGTDDLKRERRKDGCVHPFEPTEPSGYIGWHDWAEMYAVTHVQRRCPKCGLYLWEPKEATA